MIYITLQNLKHIEKSTDCWTSLQFNIDCWNHKSYDLLAQVNSSGLANTSSVSASKDSFTGTGKISSLIFVHEKAANNTSEKKATSNNNNSSDIPTLSVNAKKFVLLGNWNLKVENGKPTAFIAKFIKVLSDGNRWRYGSVVSRHTAKYPIPGTGIFGTTALPPNFSILVEYSSTELTSI